MTNYEIYKLFYTNYLETVIETVNKHYPNITLDYKLLNGKKLYLDAIFIFLTNLDVHNVIAEKVVALENLIETIKTIETTVTPKGYFVNTDCHEFQSLFYKHFIAYTVKTIENYKQKNP